MKAMRIPKLKLFVGAAVLAVAVPVAQAEDWKDHRSYDRDHRTTVVRERVVAPYTVRHIYEPEHRVVVHRPARVVTAQYVERPVYVEPPRAVVRTEYYEPIRASDVEIESVKAKLRFDRYAGLYRLNVEYDVETEHASHGQLDLVVELLDRGAPILNDRGEPIQFAVALDHPSEIDDEYDYQGRFNFQFAPGGFDPDELKANCLVVDRSYGDLLERKVVKVDFDD